MNDLQDQIEKVEDLKAHFDSSWGPWGPLAFISLLQGPT